MFVDTDPEVIEPSDAVEVSAGTSAWRRSAFLLAAALLLVSALALALRAPGLTASLPATQPDEPTVMSRALLVLDGTMTPPAFDWPLGTSLVAAAAVRTGEALGLTDRAGTVEEVYGLVRWVFMLIGVLVVAVTGLLAAALVHRREGAPPRTDARAAAGPGHRPPAWLVAVAAGGGAGIVAVDFVMVRLARMIQPDHLQVLFVLLALLAVVAAERAAAARPRLGGWLVAGALAGVAGGMKYIGITVAVVPAVSALTSADLPLPRRVLTGLGIGVAAAVGFVVSTGGTVLSSAFVDGFVEQVLHQSGGHLGYDNEGPTWVHHLVVTIPGSVGWPVALAMIAATGWSLWRGDRVRRLVAGYAVLLYAIVGLSRIVFPHYVIIVVPVLAALTGAALADLVGGFAGARDERLRWGAVALLACAVLALVPPALDGVRLLRSGAAPDTREGLVEELGDVLDRAGLAGVEVWTESYTGLGPDDVAGTGGALVFGFGDTPDILDCGCVVLVSSYQEERYAADAITGAVYTQLRERGTVLHERTPGVSLTYRWDLLPPWGIGAIPLTGDVPALGPSVTVLDLTGSGR
ncbi:hypothetical protein BH23ACT9_BH23ACT9_34000 [soil metagenome]